MATEYDGGGGKRTLTRDVSVGDEPPRASWSVDALRALRALAQCKHESFEANGEDGDELWCVSCGAVHDEGYLGAGYPVPSEGWRVPTQLRALIESYQGKGAKRGGT